MLSPVLLALRRNSKEEVGSIFRPSSIIANESSPCCTFRELRDRCGACGTARRRGSCRDDPTVSSCSSCCCFASSNCSTALIRAMTSLLFGLRSQLALEFCSAVSNAGECIHADDESTSPSLISFSVSGAFSTAEMVAMMSRADGRRKLSASKALLPAAADGCDAAGMLGVKEDRRVPSLEEMPTAAGVAEARMARAEGRKLRASKASLPADESIDDPGMGDGIVSLAGVTFRGMVCPVEGNV
mmetsp:Transcript_9427/g.17293  ORF Transcript_9427/g.17293 Transcript_9427/m.17293 type:complete len:243 (-) Transcript_9427:306-1034(-)